jgi:hypothetical protein
MTVISEVILKSKREIEDSIVQSLKNYQSKVTFLDKNTLKMIDVQRMSKFNYYMFNYDTFDDSEVEFIFQVYKVDADKFVIYIRHDFHFFIEVKDTIKDVADRHTWFVEMMIEIHKDVLIPKRN